MRERFADAGERRHAPATLRNREPILEVLEAVLPPNGLVLEVASGSGEHAAFFSSRLPAIRWQPSDADVEALASISAWGRAEGGPGWLDPVPLDTTDEPWPIERADAVVSINMIHISPWESCLGLVRGAGRVLADGAPLVLYGPFVVDGTPTAASNVAFDQSLRARDPRWGLRRLGDVERAAAEHGLTLDRTVAMPANNLTVVLVKNGGADG